MKPYCFALRLVPRFLPEWALLEESGAIFAPSTYIFLSSIIENKYFVDLSIISDKEIDEDINLNNNVNTNTDNSDDESI